jgi:hypothetical protein
MDLLLRNPVRTAALGAILINLAVSFGLHLTADQVVQLNAAIVAVLALPVPSFVTPTAAPKLPAGTSVEVITPEGEPNTTVEL